MAPVIFTDEARSNVREQLLKNGYSSIKKNGFKKTFVEDIAKQSGIAKGTFYNFFNSKEQFVIEIIKYKNQRITQNVLQYCENHALDNRESVFRFVCFIFSQENENLYSYLTFEEIRQIIEKQPDFIVSDTLAKSTVDVLLHFIPNKNPNCDWKVLVNYARIINVMRNFDDTVSFYKDALDKNISSILNLIVDEVFENNC